MFLKVTIASAATSALGIGCGSDSADGMTGTGGASTAGGAGGTGGGAVSAGGTGGGAVSAGGTGGGAVSAGGTGGSGGSPTTSGGTGGSGGSTGGSGGSTGGSGGSTGGSGGSTGGSGGSGGGGAGMCDMASLDVMQTATTGMDHDHLPLTGPQQTQLVMMINTGAPLELGLSGDGHNHTLTFTADQLGMLESGGTVTGLVSSSDNGHTHTYTISCA
jgi:hypothetical protein